MVMTGQCLDAVTSCLLWSAEGNTRERLAISMRSLPGQQSVIVRKFQSGVILSHSVIQDGAAYMWTKT